MKNLKIFAYTIIAMIALLIVAVLPDTHAFAGETVLATNAGLLYMKRQYFDVIKGKAGTNPVSPGFLRIEQTLSNSKTRYNFDVKKNQSADVATERKLDRNDTFWAYALGLFLTNQVAATIGKEKLYSFPNKTAFSTEYAQLETLYNGHMELKVANKVEIEALPLQYFRHVPTSQQKASNFIDYDQWGFEEICYWPGSLIGLHGTSEIDLYINTTAPSGLAWAAGSGSNKLVLFLLGFLVKGTGA